MSISTVTDREFGLATDDQWEKMQKFIKSNKYSKEDFFVFETLGVGDRVVPNRFQRITRPSLEVMADDAKKGVSLMLNHNEGQLGVQSIPIGKVFDSRIGPGTQEGEENALYLTQYILRDDSKVDGYSKNDIINLIESGILEDTSIGFTVPFETATCNICHKKYFGGECHHFRGDKYVVNEETGEKRTCILEINPPEFHDMHAGNVMLNEDSLVYDGAYSNAMIQQSKNGGMTIQTSNGTLKVLNDKEKVKTDLIGYGTKDGLTLMYKPFEEKGGKFMDEEKEVLENQEVTEAVEETNEEAVEDTVDTVEEATQETTEEVAEETANEAENEAENVEQKATEVAKYSKSITITEEEIKENFGLQDLAEDMAKEMILKFAKDGQKHREEVIENALNSGVRAMGNDFNKESFRKTYEKMDIEDIVSNAESFEKSVQEKYGNTRVSVDKAETEKVMQEQTIDLSLFKTSKY